MLQTIDTTWRAYNNYMAPSTYGVLPLPRHNFSSLDMKRSCSRATELFAVRQRHSEIQLPPVLADSLHHPRNLPYQHLVGDVSARRSIQAATYRPWSQAERTIDSLKEESWCLRGERMAHTWMSMKFRRPNKFSHVFAPLP